MILPESNVGKSNQGEVMAVGNGRMSIDGKLQPMNLVDIVLIYIWGFISCTYNICLFQASGDKVLLPDFGGVSVKDGDEEMFLFREDEILAKIEK